MQTTNEKKYVPEPRIVTGWHYELKCLNCGTDFHAKRISAKFCSDTCRVMHHFKNKKENLEEKIYFKTKYDLRDHLKKEFKFNLPDVPISKKEAKKVILKNAPYSIVRTSHKEYTLQKVV